MPGAVSRIRRTVVTAVGFCAAFVLASCGEEIISPPTENYSAGVPLAALSAEFDQYQFLGFVLDDAGANDTPSQSDLNAFTRADNVMGKIGVKLVWDDVNSWTGSGQTGDACALFDTTPASANKGKGMADFAVCVRINNPNGDASVVAQLAAPASPLLYSCGDSKADRCASSIKSLALGGIKCEVEKISGENFFTAGEDGADVIAACSIPLSAISATATPNLINVCSFPSGSPNSNPFDCVVTPGAGFFVIKKATTPQNSSQTFAFTISPTPVGGASHSLTDNTTGVEETGLISALPGTKSYSIGETNLPSDWSLNTASCAFDRAGAPAMGTKVGSHVDSLSIESGETTVCTFSNSRNQGSIELKKSWSGTPGQTTLKIGTSAGGSETASQLTGAGGAAPLTTGAQSVNTGTYYVSESGGLDDYSAALACTNKGSSITPGTDNAISVAMGDVVVCTFTNTRNQGSIELKKIWSGTPGQTTLKIGTTTGGSETASQLTGAAGAAPLTTGAQSVNTGTYYVSESGGLSDYGAQLACTNKGNPVTPGAGNSVSVATGDVVVCTFTNTRNQGSIELKKTWSGTPGQTTLKIGTTNGGSETASQLTGAAGAAPLSTGAKSVNTGTYYVSETGGLTDYSAQLACTNNGSPVTPGAGNSVSVGTGEVVVCTFTNTRNQGSIELKKVWSGSPGQTTLRIGTSAGGSETATQLTGAAGAAPLSTGAQSVNTGTYYVSETGGLTDYTPQLACTNKGSPITVGASNSVSVASGDVVVCTFTNTRNQGSIELKKVWVGTGGQTTLRIGTSAGGSETASQLTGAAGAAPLSTGAHSVNTGTYYVSESGGLTDYNPQLACTNKGSAISVGANNSVPVATGDIVVCTFTNTRNQGTIEVKKVWVGTPGQTTLKIGTSAGGSETASQLTGASGAAPLTTGAQGVNTGTYYVSETGGLTDYTPQLACTNKGTPFTPGANNSVPVATGDVVVCTFTNSRNQGSIELKKVWSGTGGQTTLKIGTSAGGSQVSSTLTGAAGAAPLTTNAQTVNTGTYYVSETGGLTDYTPQLACTSDGNPLTPGASNSVTVAANAVVVCTFTNTRNSGSIELKKVWSGTGGQTTLRIGTTAGAFDVASQLTGASGGIPLSTGAVGVNTGTYYVSESGGLAAYTPSLSCTSNGSPLTPGAGNSVAVANGAVVVCTFTNTVIPPSISVVKTAQSSTVAETGGNVTYNVVVTNNSTIPVTLTSLIDDKFGDLSGKGTCNGTGNLFGSIPVSGTYSCSFTGALAASNAAQTHVNEVTASASSDVGPATAKDTARVTYTDVLPNISVVKSADFLSITATGGDSVDNFVQDARFARGVGGTGGGQIFVPNICDDRGVNDINAAQNDLNCFSRADNISGHIGLRWSWDAVAQWTGSGQTGDACALLDTNNNGSANFAFCVRIYNPTATTIAQAAGSPVLYKCGDKSSDRCASPNSAQTITNSTCGVLKVPNRMTGGDDVDDIEATCDVDLNDLANNVVIANVDLLNVCSFPSGSPGSNAFDCVVTPASGFLILVDSTTSASDAYFAFTLRNATNTAPDTATNGDDKWEVQGRGSSPGLPIPAGSHSIVQSLPTNWTLGSITCTLNGASVGTTNLASLARLSVPIEAGQTTTCTFVNSLTASQTVTFTVTVTNNSLEAVNMFSLEDTENPDDASPTYSTLSGVGTCNGTGNLYGSIASGGTYVCTFTRTVSGVPGTVHKDKVRAIGKDNEFNADTKISNKVTVTIN